MIQRSWFLAIAGERSSDRRRILALFALVLWLILLIAPFTQPSYQLGMATRYQAGPLLMLSFFGVLGLQIVEVLLWSVLISEVAHRTRGVLRAGLLGLVGLGLTSYHLLLFLSWTYRASTGTFLPNRVLGLAPILFLDPEWLWDLLSVQDRGRVVLVVGAAVFMTLIGFVASLPQPARKVRPVTTIVVFIGALALGLASYWGAPVTGRKMGLQLFRSGCSPTVTLFWARWIAPAHRLALPEIHVDRFPVLVPTAPTRIGPEAPDLYLFVVEALRSDVASLDEHAGTTPFMHRLLAGPLSVPEIIGQATETSEGTVVLLTGTYPLRSQIRDLHLSVEGRDTIMQQLKRAGYATAFVGDEWPIDYAITRAGVDYRFDPDESLSFWTSDVLKTEKVVEWAAQQQGPIAVFMYFHGSHYPYLQEEGMVPLFPTSEPPSGHSFLGYGPKYYQPMWNRYRNTIHALDSLLERLDASLARVRKRPRVLMVTGDHGEGFGEHGRVTHGRAIFPEVVKVPLLIDAPGTLVRRGGPVAQLDIPPTLLDLAGLPPGPQMQGVSLLASQDQSEDRPVFSTSQLYVNQDAVVTPDGMLTIDYDTHTYRSYGVKNDAARDRLCGCVLDYRASQIRYYDPVRSLVGTRAPPRWPRCRPDAVQHLCASFSEAPLNEATP